MDSIKYIVTILFSTLGISSIIIYLGKRFIDKSLELGVEKYKNTLDKDLETHKLELSKQSDAFKAELKISELEHQIKYSKLHEERALTIKQLYSLLIELQTFLGHLTSPFQGPEWTTDTKREIDARLALDNFKNYFLQNRIYFSIGLCDKIDAILKLGWDIIVEMSVTKVTAVYNSTGPERADSLNKWHEQDVKVKSEINSARLDLEAEFRKLIGS